MRAVFLMPPPAAQKATALAAQAGLHLDIVHVDAAETLRAAFSTPAKLLLSFSTSVIVPDAILDQLGSFAVNIHGASPEYPGRDPHHFAAYDGVTRYGATMHVMTSQVDSGPIIGVERFDVDRDPLPADLLRRATDAGFVLMQRLFESLRTTGQPPNPIDAVWGSHRYTRREFLELARIDCDMPPDEVKRRLRATSMPGYNNAYVIVHGRRFRLEPPESP